MATRGRPKAVPKPITSELDLKVAEYIQNYICSIGGCIARLHVEDAQAIIKVIKEYAGGSD